MAGRQVGWCSKFNRHESRLKMLSDFRVARLAMNLTSASRRRSFGDLQ